MQTGKLVTCLDGESVKKDLRGIFGGTTLLAICGYLFPSLIVLVSSLAICLDLDRPSSPVRGLPLSRAHTRPDCLYCLARFPTLNSLPHLLYLTLFAGYHLNLPLLPYSISHSRSSPASLALSHTLTSLAYIILPTSCYPSPHIA